MSQYCNSSLRCHIINTNPASLPVCTHSVKLLNVSDVLIDGEDHLIRRHRDVLAASTGS